MAEVRIYARGGRGLGANNLETMSSEVRQDQIWAEVGKGDVGAVLALVGLGKMLFAIKFEQNRPAFLKGHVEHANAVHPSGGSGARRDGRLRRGSLAELRNELEAQPPGRPARPSSSRTGQIPCAEELGYILLPLCCLRTGRVEGGGFDAVRSAPAVPFPIARGPDCGQKGLHGMPQLYIVDQFRLGPARVAVGE